MNERDEEIEKAAREMGDLSWQYFADEAARPTTLWRLLTVRTWKKRQVPMSEWFDDEAKVKDRLAHHAANDKVETIGFDRYVLCAELAALRQQLAEARAEVERQNRQLTPYRNCDSGYIRLVPHGEDVTAWLDNGRWEKVDGWGELGPLQNLQTSIFILTNNLREFVGDITGSVPPITQPSHANFYAAGIAVRELKDKLAAQAAELERLREENQELKGRIGNALL